MVHAQYEIPVTNIMYPGIMQESSRDLRLSSASIWSVLSQSGKLQISADKPMICSPPSIFALAPPAVSIFSRVHLNFLRKRGSSHAVSKKVSSTLNTRSFATIFLFANFRPLHTHSPCSSCLIFFFNHFSPFYTFLAFTALHYIDSVVDNGQGQGSEGREGRQASFYRQERRRRQSYRHAQGQV